MIVEAPGVIRQDFSITVFYDPNTARPEAEDIQTIVNEYLNSLDIGQDIILSAIEARLIASGLLDVRINSPQVNVVVSSNLLSVAGNITVDIREFRDA